MMVRRIPPPFDLPPWNERVIVLPGIESRSRAEPNTGRIGAGIAATTAGVVYRVTSIGFTHNPTNTGRLLVSVNARVWFRGTFIAFFNGFGSAFAGLRVFVEEAGRVFSSTTDIFNAGGVVGLSFPALDFDQRIADVVVPVRAGNPIRVWADAVQSVSAAGLGVTAVSNLSMIIDNVVTTPVS
jgi:hypothetical protein